MEEGAPCQVLTPHLHAQEECLLQCAPRPLLLLHARLSPQIDASVCEVTSNSFLCFLSPYSFPGNLITLHFANLISLDNFAYVTSVEKYVSPF